VRDKANKARLDREWRAAHPERMRALHRASYQRNRNKFLERNRKQHETNPEIHRAHNAVYRAVKTGKLLRPTSCPKCGRTDKRIQAHHADYNKPLEVTWLCAPCHSKEH
jgi:ribosomal protein S27AE